MLEAISYYDDKNTIGSKQDEDFRGFVYHPSPLVSLLARSNDEIT
jgi:hypothetical protein